LVEAYQDAMVPRWVNYVELRQALVSERQKREAADLERVDYVVVVLFGWESQQIEIDFQRVCR
jgi:hypothetical protein